MLVPFLVFVAQMAPAPAACTAVAAPPAGLSAWSSDEDLPPGIGRPASLTLTPSAETKFVAPPDRMPGPGTFSGTLPLSVAKAGAYRIALSAGAWIDLIGADRRSFRSVAHIPGPECSGIRKIVDFELPAGAYTVQLSGAKEAAIRVLIVAK